MFDRLGRLAVNHPVLICVGWVVLGVCLTLVAPNWRNQAQDDDIRFLPARCASVRGFGMLEQAFPQDVFASRAIFAVERPDGPLTPADLALVDRAVAALDALKKAEPGLQI